MLEFHMWSTPRDFAGPDQQEAVTAATPHVSRFGRSGRHVPLLSRLKCRRHAPAICIGSISSLLPAQKVMMQVQDSAVSDLNKSTLCLIHSISFLAAVNISLASQTSTWQLLLSAVSPTSPRPCHTLLHPPQLHGDLSSSNTWRR